VKAHPAHPGTSELVGRAVQAAVSQMELPEGVFSLLFDGGHDVGRALVSNPHIHAVGFTGSRSGGRALVKLAAERPVPIPIHAEMSSINPVLMFKAALRNRHRDIADRFVAALTLGAGQFCTNPGLVLAMEGPELDAFITATAEEVERAPASVMLTESIFRSYCSGVERLGQHPQVERVFGKRSSQGLSGLPSVFSTTAEAFLSDVALQEEVFGASALVVRCESNAALRSCVDVLEGQLTISMHMDAEDHAFASTLLPSLEEKAGRLLVNGFGTGVEVSPAMVHGGPYPATSDGRSTSVGTMAIDRFLRPICYQDFPGELLPEGLG
jgi:NADP-dependent aldehyde dehydrogenase